MYQTYADDIYRYLYVHVRDEALAEDLTADTFTRALGNLATFDFDQPRPWLYKIARNLLTDYWRKKKPMPLTIEEDELVADTEDMTEALDKKIVADRLKGALAMLPREMRAVVTMRFVLGYSARKTAEVLGMGEGNVRVVQYRALKKMKDYLS